MFLLVCSTMIAAIYCNGQVQSLPAAFDAISETPEIIGIVNPIDFSIKGGHLQGAQWLHHGQAAYILLSGSGDHVAYCATALLDEHARLLHVDTLAITPYRHAGGFQISGDLLAVGVEDNHRKDRSKVLIYRIDDPSIPLTEPLVSIDRLGAPKRATAGCVGLVKSRRRYIIAVGDWDSRHIDFYTAASDKPLSCENRFVLVSTIDAGNADKSQWINDVWLPYQNINLFADMSGKLYLIGTATDNYGEDIADLYLLSAKDAQNFTITKIDSKNFGHNPENQFRWGAGVSYSDGNGLMILAAEYQVRPRGTIRVYR